jgi:hypothetical protein
MYNGLAVALLGMFAGILSDWTRGPKSLAAIGYGVSAICKLLLMVCGGASSAVAVVLGCDRSGKGVRTAPRDTLISLNTPTPLLATAFAVHRTLDAAGSLLGPVLTFAALSFVFESYNALWLLSFGFALAGLLVLWLAVPSPRQDARPAPATRSLTAWARLLCTRRFGALVGCGLMLSAFTVSDGFVYLRLQKISHLETGFFPLFYVITACCYVLLSIPAGVGADRFGRRPVLLSGYVALSLVYVLLALESSFGLLMLGACLALYGFYYAATEGVLAAMASAAIPPDIRASGLAALTTAVGIGKMFSSLLFGWIWERYGIQASIDVFVLTLALAIGTAVILLGRWSLPDRSIAR